MKNYSLCVLSGGRLVTLSQHDSIEDLRESLYDICRLAIISSDVFPRPAFIFKLQPGKYVSLDGNLYKIVENF